jgi:hypothetical protein
MAYNWPANNKAVTTTTDSATDKISGARQDINKTISNVNDIIDMFDLASEPTTGQILKYNGTTDRFEVGADAGGIALTDLSVNTASASGGGALAYNNSTGVFTFTPASQTGGATFTDTIQANADLSIFCGNSGTDGQPTIAGPNLVLQSTTNTFNSGTGALNSDGTNANLTFNCNKILLRGATDKAILNGETGDILIRTQEAASGSTEINIQHDENIVAVTGTLQLNTASSDPSSNLANGQIYYNTSTHKFRGYANGAWVDLH